MDTLGLAVTAGWGLLLKNETKTPAILQSIVLPIIPISECRSIYDKLNLEITDRMSCAGIAEGKSVCNGDSGKEPQFSIQFPKRSNL